MKKFRGKSIMTDNQEMVEGSGCYTDEHGREFILQDTPMGAMQPVQVKTIDRFVGLTDKFGVEIYEHDILKFTMRQPDGTPITCHAFIDEDIVTMGYALYFNLAKQHYTGTINLLNYNEVACEVVGDIYNNPELLEPIPEGWEERNK